MAADSTISETVDTPRKRRNFMQEVELFPAALEHVEQRLAELVELVLLDRDAAKKVMTVWHDIDSGRFSSTQSSWRFAR